METRTDPPESYADKLYWIEVTRVPAAGIRHDPNEMDLYCGSCDRWTLHVFLGDGWLCYTSECGGFIPLTSVENQKDFDELVENLGGFDE